MCPGLVGRALAACALLSLFPSAHAGLSESAIPESILIDPGARQSQLVLDHEAHECQVSHMSAYGDLAPGQVPFFDSNSHHPLKPHFTSFNASTGEQWEFDAISTGGEAGILIAFYRDPEFSFLGPGDLRINLDLTFPNGTMASLIDYAEHTTVESCPTHTTGTWFKQGAVYKFRIAHDMSTASVTLDAPAIRGTMELRSTSKPRCADGSAWPPAEDAAAPFAMVRGMYWMEPMPAALTSVDLTVRGSELSFSGGIGGSERIWQSRTWLEMLHGYEFLRAAVGPYAMSYWASTADEGQVGSLVLSRDGEPVFSSSLRASSVRGADASNKTAHEDDYFVLRPTYSGDLRSSVGGRAETGYDLLAMSPSRDKQWSFHFEHRTPLFEFNLGRGAGGSSFMGPAVGRAKDDDTPFQGTFVNESVDFSKLWIPSIVRSTMWAYHYTKTQISIAAKHAVDMVVAYQM